MVRGVFQRKLWIGSLATVWFLLVVGAASGRSVVPHRSGDASAARASAAVDALQHGIGLTKGCISPTNIDDPYSCAYTIRNILDEANDTLTINQLIDTVNASGGPVISGNILNLGQVTITTTPTGVIPSGATCTAASGNGISPTPYLGVTSCTLPAGSRVNVLPFTHYTVQPGDWNLPAHTLTDSVSLAWHDLCDGTPTSNCNANPADTTTVGQSLLQQLQSSTATDIHNAAHQVVTAVSAGATVHDFVTVTGQPDHSNPTGNVSIDWFQDGTCDADPTANSGPLGLDANGKVDATGFAQTVNAPGMYAFQATYSGDNRYAGSTGPCEPLQVLAAAIHIVKKADATSVMAGQQIGFTLTVSNSGAGDASGVHLHDVLPTNPGLNWTILSQGTGWGTTTPPKCAITAGTLDCGPVTVPAGTTQTASTFTVHIISPTTLATGVVSCPEVGNVNNTGSVTTTNDGSDQSSASVCVHGLTDLQITKTGSPATQTVTGHPYGNITWTMVVKNNGPLTDTNVMVGDPIPAANTYVSYTTTRGEVCTVLAAVLNCSLGTMQVGDTVTITLVTTPTITGQQINTATVVGDLPETNTTNNRATATVLVIGKVTPPPVCTTVLVKPKQFNVNQPATAHITVMKAHKPVEGVRVRIWGKGTHISLITNKSNTKGKITQQLHPKKTGVLYFKPVASKACKVSRVGIAGVIHPTG
jgi:uncharacterized repeat protein (TIGR01451 family)